MMTFGLMPLGAVPASIAADAIGTPAVTAIGGGLLMMSVVGAYAALPAVPNAGRRDPDPARGS